MVIGLGTTSEIASRHYTQLTQFIPVVEAKAYEHHAGKVLHSATFSCTKNELGWSVVSIVSLLQLVSCHVIENQEISFTKFGTESGCPFIRFKLAILHNYYMLVATILNCIMPFKFCGCGLRK